MTRCPTPSAPCRPAAPKGFRSMWPAVLAAAAALALVGCGRGTPAPAADAAPGPATSRIVAPKSPEPGKPAEPGVTTAELRPALVVETVVPERVPIADTLSAHGSIEAWQEASVGAEVSGLRLAQVQAQVGDRVRRGQVLAVFADDLVQADLASARAALAEAQAAVGEARAAAANAQADADRAAQVEASGALSAQQIAQYRTAAQTAQARLASAQARVSSAQAQLQSQQLRLRMTRVQAPDDGTVSARTATVGAVVPAGQELFRLVRGDRLEWRGEVTATELGRLVPRQSVRVLPASGGEVRGTVRTIGPVVDPQTRNAIVYVDLPAGTGLRPGMFARGEFGLGTGEGWVVPQQAVVVRDGFAYVFRIEGQRVAQVKVRTGRRVGDRIEILEGLAADTPVVARGAGFLNEGDLVRVVGATAAGSPR